MKVRLILTIISVTLLSFALEPNAGAALYTGSITGGDGLIGFEAWSDATLSWEVDDTTNPGAWTYQYTFTVCQKDISHVILEVSETFTPDNLLSQSVGYTMDPDAPKWYGGNGNSNPGIPQDLFGIKWDDVGALTFSKTIVTNRDPMWGDFYAKSGKDDGEWVYAYNTNFGVAPGAIPIGSGNAGGWILVPDTSGTGGEVPLPSAVWLLGSGLIGLAGWNRKARKWWTVFGLQ